MVSLRSGGLWVYRRILERSREEFVLGPGLKRCGIGTIEGTEVAVIHQAVGC